MVINVYESGKHIDTFVGPTDFVVFRDSSGEIHWEKEKTAQERIRSRLSGTKPIGGSLLLRILGKSGIPQIELVTREWNLSINDLECPNGTYVKLPCRYNKVVLSQSDFVVEVSNDSIPITGDVQLPQPGRKRQK